MQSAGEDLMQQACVTGPSAKKTEALSAVGGSFMGRVPRKFSLAQRDLGLSNAASGHDLCVLIHVPPPRASQTRIH